MKIKLTLLNKVFLKAYNEAIRPVKQQKQQKNMYSDEDSQ